MMVGAISFLYLLLSPVSPVFAFRLTRTANFARPTALASTVARSDEFSVDNPMKVLIGECLGVRGIG